MIFLFIFGLVFIALFAIIFRSLNHRADTDISYSEEKFSAMKRTFNDDLSNLSAAIDALNNYIQSNSKINLQIPTSILLDISIGRKSVKKSLSKFQRFRRFHRALIANYPHVFDIAIYEKAAHKVICKSNDSLLSLSESSTPAFTKQFVDRLN